MLAMYFLFVVILHLSLVSWGQSSECLNSKAQFEQRFARLSAKYKKFSKEDFKSENKPSWTWGRKKQAVYLLHGFIGTPHEMEKIATILRKENFTVINDIIPGHGLNGYITNQYDEKSWLGHVAANLSSARNCFDKIHLVGFSTGALLIHHYLRQSRSGFKAQSVTLYSPFYKADLTYVAFLAQAASHLISVVPTKPLYAVTHFPDIKVAVLKPENYLQQLPLDTAKAIFQFGEKVHEASQKFPLLDEETPVHLFISKTDKIIDYQESLRVTSSDFRKLDVTTWKDTYVPHHLMVSEVSPVSKEVFAKTLQFILRHP